MASYSKIALSGGTDNKGIKVAATSIGSGTTIHTHNGSGIDYLTLYAYNSDTVSRELTLGWGGTTDPDNTIRFTVPSRAGLIPVAVKLPISGSLAIKAAGDAANVIVVYGEGSKVA